MKKERAGRERPELTTLQHPPGQLWQDAVIFVILAVASILVNNYVWFFNFWTFLFVRPGSLLLLVLVVATLVYAVRIVGHLAHGILALRKEYRAIIFVLIVIAAALVLLFQHVVVPSVIGFLLSLPWSNLYPFTFWFVY
jgi:hypothetical protein